MSKTKTYALVCDTYGRDGGTFTLGEFQEMCADCFGGEADLVERGDNWHDAETGQMVLEGDPLAVWRAANNMGDGEAWGTERMRPIEAAATVGATHIEEITADGVVVCRFMCGTYVVADANGPWAVRIA